MKASTIPEGVPVLGPGRHRSPRKGACFMEFVSFLAGERWSDHPSCTHPLLTQLAQQVNDCTSDAARQRLVPLAPSVVGRRGTDTSWLTVAVAVAAGVIADAPEPKQRVLAAGLFRAEQLCVEAGPAMAETRRTAGRALDSAPGAAAWARRLGSRNRITLKTFNKRCAPIMIRTAVDSVAAGGGSARDGRLRGLLEAGIAVCPRSRDEAPAATRPSNVVA